MTAEMKARAALQQCNNRYVLPMSAMAPVPHRTVLAELMWANSMLVSTQRGERVKKPA
jgi:hypothetical protein